MARIGIVSIGLYFLEKFLGTDAIFFRRERDLPEYHTLEAWHQEQKFSIQVDDIEVVLGQLQINSSLGTIIVTGGKDCTLS